MSWRRSPGRLALARARAQGATARDTLGVTQCLLTTSQELVFFKASVVTVYCAHRGVPHPEGQVQHCLIPPHVCTAIPEVAYLQKSPAPTPAHLSTWPCPQRYLSRIAAVNAGETGPGPVRLASVTEHRVTRCIAAGSGARVPFGTLWPAAGRAHVFSLARQGLSGSFPLKAVVKDAAVHTV